MSLSFEKVTQRPLGFGVERWWWIRSFALPMARRAITENACFVWKTQQNALSALWGTHLFIGKGGAKNRRGFGVERRQWRMKRNGEVGKWRIRTTERSEGGECPFNQVGCDSSPNPTKTPRTGRRSTLKDALSNNC